MSAIQGSGLEGSHCICESLPFYSLPHNRCLLQLSEYPDDPNDQILTSLSRLKFPPTQPSSKEYGQALHKYNQYVSGSQQGNRPPSMSGTRMKPSMPQHQPVASDVCMYGHTIDVCANNHTHMHTQSVKTHTHMHTCIHVRTCTRIHTELIVTLNSAHQCTYILYALTGA